MVRVYKIQVVQDSTPYFVTTIKRTLEDVELLLEQNDIGDSISITPAEMTEEEIKNAPEWGGP